MTRDRFEERRLFRRIADGRSSAEEFRDFERRLLADPELRSRYVRHMGLEADLYEFLARPPQSPPISPVGARRRKRLRAAFATIAAVAVVAVAFVFWPRRDVVPSHFIEAELHGLREVAVVTRSDVSASGAPFKPGRRLKPGVLKLGEGMIELEFFNGARVVVEGPSELHLLSSEMATLVSGRAAARVPESARGFVLNAPGAAVVDLGTEFALAVDEEGESEVHVVDGEVEVSLLGDDGNTLTSERIGESETLRAGAAGLEQADHPSVSLPTVGERRSEPLRVSRSYVDAVLASKPAIYWRFENFVDGRVPNEVAAEWPAVGGGAGVGSILVQDGVARFTRSDQPRYLSPEQPIPLNVDSFTIEFWVNPDDFQTSTVAAVIPDGEVWADYHLNVVELANFTSLVHPPGTFRFLHRHPPRKRGGVNLFSGRGYTPGTWQHVVAVKTPRELTLFIDGEVTRRIEKPAGSDDLSYRLLVGQLRRHTLERQLIGAIDEFAVYLRALSDKEARLHYETLVGGSSQP